ncbi:tape measure protein [Enterococcus sp. AZ126]|uniref:tape measure protein n=1 Tax=Enterococcus sp. AZ126 TaxID=2774635 RepID=UPI003F2158DC
MAESKSVTAVLRAKDNGFTSTFQKASGLLGKFSSGAKGVTGSAGGVVSSMKSIAGAMGLVKVAGMAVSTVTGKISAAMGRADTMDSFNKTLKLMGYSAQETAAGLDSLKGITKGTAYGLDVAAKATQNFVSRGMEIGAATKSVGIWADAVSAYGKGTNDELSGVTDALAKMRTKGKVEMDQLNRLFDVGIDAVGMYAKAMGRSSNDVQESLSKGEISAADFLDTVETAMTEGTNGVVKVVGAAKNAGTTWRGVIDNMGAAVTRGVLAMITQFDELAKKLTGLTIKEWIAATGKFAEENLTKIATAVGGMAEKVKAYLTLLTPYIDILKQAFKQIAPAVSNAFTDVLSSAAGFSKAFITSKGTIESFRDAVQIVSAKIIQFSGYISANADKIGLLITQIPKLVFAFKGLQIVNGIGGYFASFGSSALALVGDISKLNTELGTKLMNGATIAKGAFSGLFNSFQSGLSTFTNGVGTFVLKNREIFNATKLLHSTGKTNIFESFTKSIMAFVPESRNFLSAINMGQRRMIAFGSSVASPVRNLKNLNTSIISAGGILPFFSNGVVNATKVIGLGFKGMASAGVSAIRVLTTAMLSNPITALILLLGVAIAGLVAAWRSNFQNIQGFTKSAFGAIGNSIKSLGSMFKGFEPVLKVLGNSFKWLGIILGGALLVALASIVDGFRSLVFAGVAVVKTASAVGNAIKGLWAKMKGDNKGADKAFKDMKNDLSGIKDDFKNLIDNSAMKGVAESTKELGKETNTAGETIKALRANIGETNDGLGTYSAKLDEAKQKLTDAFNVESANTATEKYFKTTLDLLDSIKEKQLSATDNYNKQIEAAEGKSEEAKQKIYADAAALYTETVKKSNDDMLTVYKDYSKQLKENKNVEGQALNDQQRQALQEGTESIRTELTKQNQDFVDAAVSRMANGQRLSDEERKQAVDSLRTLGEIQAEQTKVNNDQIKVLEEQRSKAKTESEKAAFQSQITSLQENNAQILETEMTQGAQLIDLLSRGGQEQALTVANGLAQMKGVTDTQLAGIYQSYVKMGADTDAQMMLLSGLLRQRGVDSSNGLVQGLMTNDPSLWANMSKEDIVNTLNALPPEMFTNGQTSKNQLLDGLKSGTTDMDAVGKTLMQSLNKGQESQKPNTIKVSKDNARSGSDAAKKEKSQYEAAGNANGSGFVSGINKQNPNAKASGTNLANSAELGARSVDFVPTGSNMAAGVATGITAGKDGAVSAMKDLVTAVNEEAKKKAEIKSPSRLFRDTVGKFIAQGVAVGIEEDTKLAVASARNMIDDIQGAVTDKTNKVSTEFNVEYQANNQLKNTLDEMVDTIKNMKVVLDNGALVGGIGNQMDGFLGGQASYARRYRS